jgi:rSAM/selenodomain-associated transferase 2
MISHLTPPLAATELYDELLELRQLVETWESASETDSPTRERALTLLREKIAVLDIAEDLENAEIELRRGSTVSVIIPTLNEAKNIGGLLKKLASSNPHEIIVCDGGSDDETVTIARENGATVISSKPNRSTQMNQGAALANGEFLLFLHADTEAPEDFPKIIPAQLNRPNTSAGAFTFRLDDELGAAALIETLVAWRCRLLQSPYGDQGLFLRKSTFLQIGGFPESRVAEDLLLVRKLRRLGKIRIARQRVITSSRRWRKHGLIRTFLSHQKILVLSLFRTCQPFLSRSRR